MKTSARTRARRLAMQGLYEWQVSDNKPSEIETQYLIEKETDKVDVAYFRELISKIPLHCEELDGHIAPLISRPLDEVDLVELAVLRLGTYELLYHPEIPYRVVINEAVELAKMFGADQGHRFVNGIMDRLAASLRTVEVQAHL
ncbi:MAG: transcription antitermination factor NusB [Halobacteria archaeon]|nr:transcription antitermination factor NusB [Halobacteria archaeon]